ncbi:MAG: UbiA family prenyltransferase [Candidatus Marinimicrobia bacterium]|nr:UbiA family prenyltransferase [Candidatus Neomarinimicrobiota bacterium]
MKFIKAYIKSMRLYYSFITGIAGWIGVAHYEHIVKEFRTVEVMPGEERKGIILVLLFLSWGINQIFNDYLGRKEDAINAPHRPMVTGELNPVAALTLSTFLMLGAGLVTWLYLEPVAIIPLLLGVLLNIIYEYAKGCGIWGNVIFGLMIAQCTAFGFLASGPTQAPYFTESRMAVLSIVWLMNGLMTFYTYFKDYEGDKAAGKKTLVVEYGLEKSRFIAIFASILPGVLFLVLYFTNQIIARINPIFIILGLITLFLEIQTGWLYYKSPKGKVTYYALATNFRACACGQATFIALNNTELAMVLFLISYVFVGFLFNLHSDVKG